MAQKVNGSNGGNLTEKDCQSAKPTELEGRTQRLPDGGGLALQVSAKGKKEWFLTYRGIRESLGEYPAVSLAQARANREKARARIEAAGPAPEKKAEPKPAAKPAAKKAAKPKRRSARI
jgi:Arm DNA-binding domain